MPKTVYGPRTERVTPERRARYIAESKAKEQNTDCASLIGNIPTMRLILVWPKVEIYVPDEPVDYPAELQKIARRIWLGVEIDHSDLSQLARIPYTKVKEHLREAQMNLWIYPDGTVHEHARRLSIATMARLAKSKKEEKSRDKS